MSIEELQKNLLETIILADRKAAVLVIDHAFEQGVVSQQIITDILDPVLVKIGDLWIQESISMAQAFVGAKIAEDTLLRCLETNSSEIVLPHKGIVVIGNVEDDYHSLGRRMIISFLQASGWEIHDMGNDVLAEDFLAKALEVNAQIIAVSAMMHTTAMNIKKLRDLIDSQGMNSRIKLAVGGAVFNWRPELVTEVGGDGTAQNASGVDLLFTQLLNQLKEKE